MQQAALLALEELHEGFSNGYLTVRESVRRQHADIKFEIFAQAADTATSALGAVGKLLDTFLR